MLWYITAVAVGMVLMLYYFHHRERARYRTTLAVTGLKIDVKFVSKLEALVAMVHADSQEWHRRYSGIGDSLLWSKLYTLVPNSFPAGKYGSLAHKPLLINRPAFSEEMGFQMLVMRPKALEMADNAKVMFDSHNYLEVWRRADPADPIFIFYPCLDNVAPWILDESVGLRVVNTWPPPALPPALLRTKHSALVGDHTFAPCFQTLSVYDGYTRNIIVVPGGLMVLFKFNPPLNGTKVTGAMVHDAHSGDRIRPQYECFVASSDQHLWLFEPDLLTNYLMDCDSCINTVSLGGERTVAYTLVFDSQIFLYAKTNSPKYTTIFVGLNVGGHVPHMYQVNVME